MENDVPEGDRNLRNSLRMTLEDIAKKRQGEPYLHEERIKLKYKTCVLKEKINRYLTNQHIPGNWEWTVKDLIDSLPESLQKSDKMSMGNRINIKHLKEVMKRDNNHVNWVKKGSPDWIYLAAMLAIESHMEEQVNWTLEDCLWAVTENGPPKSRYNWGQTEADILQGCPKPVKQRKPRPKGPGLENTMIKALKKAKGKKIKLTVDGKRLDKISLAILRKKEISWCTQVANHINSTEYNQTEEMKQDTKLKITTFTKKSKPELIDKMEKALKTTREKAEFELVEKKAKHKNKHDNPKKDTQTEQKEKPDNNRSEMTTNRAFMKCQICNWMGTTTVIQEGSKKAHFKAFHRKNMNIDEQDLKHFFPVVKIIEK